MPSFWNPKFHHTVYILLVGMNKLLSIYSTFHSTNITCVIFKLYFNWLIDWLIDWFIKIIGSMKLTDRCIALVNIKEKLMKSNKTLSTTILVPMIYAYHKWAVCLLEVSTTECNDFYWHHITKHLVTFLEPSIACLLTCDPVRLIVVVLCHSKFRQRNPNSKFESKWNLTRWLIPFAISYNGFCCMVKKHDHHHLHTPP